MPVRTRVDSFLLLGAIRWVGMSRRLIREHEGPDMLGPRLRAGARFYADAPGTEAVRALPVPAHPASP